MLKNIMGVFARQQKEIAIHVLKGKESTRIKCKTGTSGSIKAAT